MCKTFKREKVSYRFNGTFEVTSTYRGIQQIFDYEMIIMTKISFLLIPIKTVRIFLFLDIFPCAHNSYIGDTQTTLSRRLTMHKGSGAINDHMQRRHNLSLTEEALVNITRNT